MSVANSIDSVLYVLFELAGSTCGVCSDDVQSVEMVEHITSVPNTLPFVEGVTLVRGRVIPGINLRSRFGFPKIPTEPGARMLVVRSKDRVLGMLVDGAREFVSIPQDLIHSSAEDTAGFEARYVEGIATLGERTVLILNLEEVFEEAQ